jgi:hypothetical protein
MGWWGRGSIGQWICFSKGGQVLRPLFLFGANLSAWRALADVLGEARDRYLSLRFVLDAIDSAQYSTSPDANAGLRRGLCDRVQADGWSHIPFVREGDFNAIGEAREGYVQVRMTFRQMLERFSARRDHGCLQLRRGVILHARRFG